jgi:hypothetical protein
LSTSFCLSQYNFHFHQSIWTLNSISLYGGNLLGGKHLLSARKKTKEGSGAREHLGQACEIFAKLETTYDLGRAQAELASKTGPVSL